MLTRDLSGYRPATGTVEILVALSGAERAGVQRLQTHAAETQAPLVEFAGRRFRLTDAVLVTVNTGRLSLDTRADTEGAEVKKPGW
ncbi:MAG: hypothetical protein J07HX64_01117 [halophilic archaeon J07HX64]|nr:MAG: hypothetical protein J07HX64_01117 [halophilic archaeon J07HX64]